MKKDVMINMKSVQFIHDEKSEIDFLTQGMLETVKDGFLIKYDETEMTGYENSSTELKCLGDNYISMIRSGSVNSHLIIEKNKKHYCHYGTPHGDFTIGIQTHSIVNKLTETGGRISFKYTIDVNSGYISDNEIHLIITEE